MSVWTWLALAAGWGAVELLVHAESLRTLGYWHRVVRQAVIETREDEERWR